MRVVFMGTPDFAVPSLNILAKNKYTIAGVVTAPDKPAGRGKKLMAPAVKKYAVEHELPLFQPEKLRDETFVEKLKELNADLIVVVAFRMLPAVVWKIPRYGTFNLHASLLPDYRGAAPINWAIINGETETGATTFFIDEDIDTGNIILQEKTTIAPDENAGDLHDKLMLIGAGLVLKTVKLIEQDNGQVKTFEQETIDVSHLKRAPKITKEYCRIVWNDSAEKIYNFIRGLSPYPAAWTTLTDGYQKTYQVKIFTAEYEVKNIDKPAGTIIPESMSLPVVVNDGYIKIKELQLEGKKRLKAEEFLRGFKDITNYTFK